MARTTVIVSPSAVLFEVRVAKPKMRTSRNMRSSIIGQTSRRKIRRMPLTIEWLLPLTVRIIAIYGMSTTRSIIASLWFPDGTVDTALSLVSSVPRFPHSSSTAVWLMTFSIGSTTLTCTRATPTALSFVLMGVSISAYARHKRWSTPLLIF